ncbi:hypothetical protein F4810DRAFT_691913 [Camillea tinctor]|nr:hypothetical protein F4810DRAFT_691913 [Camillea tinctor]
MSSEEAMDSVRALVSRPTSDEPSIIICKDKSAVCYSHKKPLCPECEVGCDRCTSPGATLEIHGETLHVAENEEIYTVVGGAQDRVLFSWSPNYENDDRLAALQSSDTLNIRRGKALSLASHFRWTPRFIPQWDEQVEGVQIWDISRRFKHVSLKPPSPLPPDQLKTTYCSECQLTWITGDTGAQGHSHPTHNALSARDTVPYIIEQRSIIVHICGENREMGDGRKDGVGRLGIYFGPNSKYNHSEPIYLTGDSATRRCAQIHAVRLALLIVKENVVPDYVTNVERIDKANSTSPPYNPHQMLKKYRVEKPFEPDDASQDRVSEMNIRLVLATGSKNLVDLFCDQIDQWQYDEETQELRRPARKGGKKKGLAIKNNEIISDIYNELNELAGAPVGIQVCWYHIPPQFDDEARKLADASLG